MTKLTAAFKAQREIGRAEAKRRADEHSAWLSSATCAMCGDHLAVDHINARPAPYAGPDTRKFPCSKCPCADFVEDMER